MYQLFQETARMFWYTDLKEFTNLIAKGSLQIVLLPKLTLC